MRDTAEGKKPSCRRPGQTESRGKGKAIRKEGKDIQTERHEGRQTSGLVSVRREFDRAYFDAYMDPFDNYRGFQI